MQETLAKPLTCRECGEEISVRVVRPHLCPTCAGEHRRVLLAQRAATPPTVRAIRAQRAANQKVVLSPEYEAYLQSSEWEYRRMLVLDRDNHTCQACLHEAATEVHHLVYDHLFAEPLFDLVAICHDCHALITARDRAAREAS